MLRISIRDTVTGRTYEANLTARQYARHDNGAMISCGLSAPRDISARLLSRWVSSGTAREIPFDKWNHSGCQSACKLRGDAECRW